MVDAHSAHYRRPPRCGSLGCCRRLGGAGVGVHEPEAETAHLPTRLGRAAPLHIAVFTVAIVLLASAFLRDPGRFLRVEYLLWIGLIATAELLPVPVWREARLEMSFPLSLATAVLYPPGVAGAISFLGSFDLREFRREVPV